VVSTVVKIRYCDTCVPILNRREPAQVMTLPEIWTIGEDQESLLLDVCDNCARKLSLATFLGVLEDLGRPCDPRGRPVARRRAETSDEQPPDPAPEDARQAPLDLAGVALPATRARRNVQYPCLCCDHDPFHSSTDLAQHAHRAHEIDMNLIFTDSRCAFCGLVIGATGKGGARGVAQHSKQSHGYAVSAVDSYRIAMDQGDPHGVVSSALARATIHRDVAI